MASWDLGHLHHQTSDPPQLGHLSCVSRGSAHLSAKPLGDWLSASRDTTLPKPHRVAASSPERDVCTPWCSGDTSLLSLRCDVPGNHVPRARSQQSKVQRAREPGEGVAHHRASVKESERAAWAGGRDTAGGLRRWVGSVAGAQVSKGRLDCEGLKGRPEGRALGLSGGGDAQDSFFFSVIQ